MNPKSTWTLLTLALGLFTYIIFFERPSSDEGRTADLAARLFPNFDPAKATAVGISRTNSSIGAERLNDRWQLTKPVYPAQATGIEELLQLIALLPRHDQISAKEVSVQKGGLAAFGLQPPNATITVSSGTNRFGFGVGSRTLTGDRLYVQVTGEPGILVTEARLLERLPASADEWRNPLLMHEERLLADQVAVTNETKFTIVRQATNQLWRLVRPLEAAADGNGVENLLQQLRTARVSQFVTDDLAADLERYGLQAPKVQLTLARGTNAVFQLQIGQSPTNNPALVYARLLSHSNIVLVAKELADLLQRPHTAFRDRTLLSFAESAVSRVEVKASQTFALQRQTNGTWLIVGPFTARADSESIRELFASLARLEIIDFEKDLVEATDLPTYGLTTPGRRYVLKTTATNTVGTTNLVLAQVEFGTNRVDKIYARRGDEKSVYTVSYGVVSQLPQSAFEMRDRRIWSFDETNVVSVTLTQRSKTNRLERNPQRLWSADLVFHAHLDEVLHRLGALRAVSWRAKGDDQVKLLSFLETDNQLTLGVTADGKTRPHTIRFGKLASEGHVYSAVMLEEGEWIVFLFPGPLYLEIVRVLGHPAAANP